MRRIQVLLFALATGGTLLATTAHQQNETFFFPEAQKKVPMNRVYGEQSMADKLYGNATKYFRLALEEATTPEEQAEVTQLLARAFFLDQKYDEALKTVNGLLETQGESLSGRVRCQVLLTAGQAALQKATLLKDDSQKNYYETARNFLDPLRKESAAEELGELYPQFLCALADVWNALGQEEKTLELLTPALKKTDTNSRDFSEMAWRQLEAALAEGQWKTARETLNDLENTQLQDAEKNKLHLAQLRCDLGEGAIDEALQTYRTLGLPAKKQRTPSLQWWDTLSKLAQACQTNKLLKEAAEIYGITRNFAPTEQDDVAAAKSQAAVLLDMGELEQAIPLLDELHELRPEESELTLRLAEVNRDLNRRGRATELFLVLTENPSNSQELRYRAAIEAARCLAKEGLSQKAEQTFRMAAEELGRTSQEKAGALRAAAEEAEKDQRLTAAVALFQQTADSFGGELPEASEARLEAGRILMQQGDIKASLAQFEKFLQESPNSPRQWEAKMAIGQAMEDRKTAMEILLDVARGCPNPEIGAKAFFEAHAKAMTTEAEDLPTAVEILQEFILKYPNVNPDWIRLARHKNIVYGFQLGLPKAMEWGQAFLKDYPEADEMPVVALRMADVFAEEGNFKQATELYAMTQKAHQTSPKLKALARYEEANAMFLGNGDLETAAKILSEIPLGVAKGEIMARIKFLTGDILTKQNRPEEALQAFNEALEEAGDGILKYPILGRMAETYYVMGQFTEARNQAILIRNAGKDVKMEILCRANLILARCYRMENKDQKAVDIYCDLCTRYEGAREKMSNAPTPNASEVTLEVTPEVYVAAIREVLEILEARASDTEASKRAERIRGKYAEIPGLPPLPPSPMNSALPSQH